MQITSDYMKGIFDNGSETFIEDISVVDNSDDWLLSYLSIIY